MLDIDISALHGAGTTRAQPTKFRNLPDTAKASDMWNGVYKKDELTTDCSVADCFGQDGSIPHGIEGVGSESYSCVSGGCHDMLVNHSPDSNDRYIARLIRNNGGGANGQCQPNRRTCPWYLVMLTAGCGGNQGTQNCRSNAYYLGTGEGATAGLTLSDSVPWFAGHEKCHPDRNQEEHGFCKNGHFYQFFEEGATSHLPGASGTISIKANDRTLCQERRVVPSADLGQTSDKIEELDCIKADELERLEDNEYMRNNIPFNTDVTGSPHLQIFYQQLGKLHFVWSDFSLCEDSFSFTRDGLPFIEDFFGSAPLSCGETYSPTEALYDDLRISDVRGQESRPVGQMHDYCIRASSEVGVGEVGYTSNTECYEHTIMFETRVQGTVVSKNGKIPIAGVQVEYRLCRSSGNVNDVDSNVGHCHTENAVVFTGADGKYSFTVADRLYKSTSDVRKVHMTFSKTSRVDDSDFLHSFTCPDGLASDPGLCGGIDDANTATKTIVVQQFSFDNTVDAVEHSSVPISGRVYFPMPADVEAQATVGTANTNWRTEWSTQAQTCSLPEATVCLHDHSENGFSLGCTTTAGDGTYSLAAPPGLRVTIRVSKGTHSEGNFSRARHSNTAANGEMMARHVNDPVAGAAEEVFEIRPLSTTYAANMDFQDHTTRTVTIEAYGTNCKLKLGDQVFFKATRVCGTMRFSMSSTGGTSSSYTVPAHSFDFHIESVAPDYAEVTDMSEYGYFHRMRTRQKFIDLFEEAESGPHRGTWEYHPKPELGLSFSEGKVPSSSDMPHKQAVPETVCGNVNAKNQWPKTYATDLQHQEQQGPAYSPVNLTGSDRIPSWDIPASTYVTAEVNATAIIKYPPPPADDTGDYVYPNCTYVDGAVSHLSRLGLSATDLGVLARGDEDPEKKDFQRVVQRSLPNLKFATVADTEASTAMLEKCTQPGQALCTNIPMNPVVESTISTAFGDDETCSRTESGKTLTDYSLLGAAADASSAVATQAACELAWQTRLGIDANTDFELALHRKGWDKKAGREQFLTNLEQQAWNYLGVTKEKYDTIIESAGDWNIFSQKIFKGLPNWAALDCTQKQHAAALGYSAQTWGRAWAFAERFFGYFGYSAPFSTLADLSAGERAIVKRLGRHYESSFASPPVQTPRTKETSWAHLMDSDKNALRELGFTDWLWNQYRDTTEIAGCFWDQATGAATIVIQKPRHYEAYPPADTPCLGNGPPNQRSRRSRTCPAGQESTGADMLCKTCSKEFYKSAAMTEAGKHSCESKGVVCSTNKYYYGSSTTSDDSVCVPAGFCAPGAGGANCGTCAAGTFSNRATENAKSCKDKTITECVPGMYLHEGSSSVYDDNVCLVCPPNTISTGPADVLCESKHMPPTCGAGHYLAAGTSTTAHDNTCQQCAPGQFKAGGGYSTCSVKSTTSCPPGKYFLPGSSHLVDDNDCIDCPAGTYSDAMSSTASTCTAKFPVSCLESPGGGAVYLRKGGSRAANDNECVPAGQCPRGTKVSADSACESTILGRNTACAAASADDAACMAATLAGDQSGTCAVKAGGDNHACAGQTSLAACDAATESGDLSGECETIDGGTNEACAGNTNLADCTAATRSGDQLGTCAVKAGGDNHACAGQTSLAACDAATESGDLSGTCAPPINGANKACAGNTNLADCTAASTSGDLSLGGSAKNECTFTRTGGHSANKCEYTENQENACSFVRASVETRRTGSNACQYTGDPGSTCVFDACVACESGKFSASTSAATACVPKNQGTGTIQCAGGEYVDVGVSTTTDDARCKACPSGSFTRAGTCAVKPGGGVNAACDGQTSLATCNAASISGDSTGTCAVKPGGGVNAACAGQTTLATCTAASPADARNACVFVGDPANVCVFTAAKHSGKFCQLKLAKIASCAPGFHVSKYHDQTADDSACVACPSGMYSTLADEGSLAVVCRLKKRPGACFAGQYIMESGPSATTDDTGSCYDCPPGTFKTAADPTSATACATKTTSSSCAGSETFVPSNRPDADNVCRETSECNMGEFVQGGDTCVACPSGKYNPGKTTLARCSDKIEPRERGGGGIGCPAGHAYAKGISRVRDDWACLKCPENTFQPQPLGTGVSDIASVCREKGYQPQRLHVVESISVASKGLITTKTAHGFEVDDMVYITGVIGTDATRFIGRAKVMAPVTTTSFAVFRHGATVAGTSETRASDQGKTKVQKDNRCPYGEEVHRGKSSTTDDWRCAPSARYRAMCATTRLKDSVSTVYGLIAGQYNKAS